MRLDSEGKPRPSDSPRPGTKLGRYDVYRCIGGGGMAEVYLGRLRAEHGLRRFVAIKRILPRFADNRDLIRMFRDEVRLASRVEHANVVQVIDSGTDDEGLPFLVMELIRGASLAWLMSDVFAGDADPLPIPVVTHWIGQAALGLEAAHTAVDGDGTPLEIVHRDVSPQNILIDIAGRARVTDFGIARAERRVHSTQFGQVKGKLAYMAPEQALGDAMDARADIFGLAVVLWECVAGRRLFEVKSPALVEEKLRSRKVPDLREIRPAVSERLAEVVGRGLAADPDDRPGSAAEFAEDLRRATMEGYTPPTEHDLVGILKERARAKLDQIATWIEELPIPASQPPPASAPPGARLLESLRPTLRPPLRDHGLRVSIKHDPEGPNRSPLDLAAPSSHGSALPPMGSPIAEAVAARSDNSPRDPVVGDEETEDVEGGVPTATEGRAVPWRWVVLGALSLALLTMAIYRMNGGDGDLESSHLERSRAADPRQSSQGDTTDTEAPSAPEPQSNSQVAAPTAPTSVDQPAAVTPSPSAPAHDDASPSSDPEPPAVTRRPRTTRPQPRNPPATAAPEATPGTADPPPRGLGSLDEFDEFLSDSPPSGEREER